MTRDRLRLIQGSKGSFNRWMPNFRRRIPSRVTFTKPLPPLLALCEDDVPPRLLARLRTLDREQMQIVEVVVAAIARGARE